MWVIKIRQNMNKHYLRKHIIKKRSMMTPDEVNYKSLNIIDRIMELNCYKNSKIVMCYMDIKNEVSLQEFIKKSLESKKRICIPRIEGDSHGRGKIEPYEIKDMENDVEKGAYGIPEPEKFKCKKVKPDSIDIVIVPGIVFDMNGHRIGYGAGYYDIFLKSVNINCMKIAASYEMQLVEKIKNAWHDVPVDIIVTEKRVIKCSNQTQ